MEGLKLRSFVVGGLLVATAAFAAISGRASTSTTRNEDWMKKVTPVQVGNYHFQEGTEPGASYKSPAMVYETLAPTVGILARVYEHGGQRYDVTVIASTDHTSFHDPRVCFSAQGYTITSDQAITIPTKTRGNIPASLAQMTGPNGPTVAIFFYRGSEGFYGTTLKLKWAMLYDKLRGKNEVDGVFYRIIPMGDISTERLIRFTALYMDTAGQTSKGYF